MSPATNTTGNQAIVTVTVPVDPATAFAIFTEETDLWWRRGPEFRVSGRRTGVLQFEGKPGGRLMEMFETESGTHVHVTGIITVRDPPHRLQLDWRGANFAAEERTEVEILFQPVGAKTQVTVHHRGWASLRPDHPVRHGLAAAAFIRMMGLWWGELLTSYRELAAEKN